MNKTHTPSAPRPRARPQTAAGPMVIPGLEFSPPVGGGEPGALLAVYSRLAAVEEALAQVMIHQQFRH